MIVLPWILALPWLASIGFYIGWLFGGHYYFRAPHHVLRGHQVTVYGISGLLLALAVYAGIWVILGLPAPVVWYIVLTPAVLVGIGGILTKWMHRHDQGTIITERYADIVARLAVLERERELRNDTPM